MIHGQYEDYTVVVTGFNARPEADFEQLDTSLCLYTREFNYSGAIGGTSYQWFFGDGSTLTTTLPNVTHTYINSGIYTVELRVSNSFGSDTIVKVNSVRIFGAVAGLTNCTPTIANTSNRFGITRVRLNGLDYSSATGTDGYLNSTCTRGVFLTPGVANVLTVNAPSGNTNNFRVFIDWNNNGRFDNGETIANTQSTTGQFIVSIIPPLSVQLNTPLRMRIVAASNATNNACSNIAQGEVEDLVVVAKYPDQVPSARFGVNERSNCTGYFQFTDSSLYLPNAFRWVFGDNLGTSTQRNPNFTFNAPGSYAVKLVVTNAFGSDSIVRTNFVTVQQSYGLVAANCTPIATFPQASTGITNVTFLGVNNNTSDSREGYRDFACSQFASVTRGQSINFSISQQVNAGFMGVWADWNMDGNFSASELMLQSGSGVNPFSGSFVVPQSARSGRIRLRIAVDFNDLIDPCLNSYGQVEDYGLDVQPSNRAPVAGFAVFNNNCEATVRFADSSSFDPTTWLWNFGDNSTSTERNPSHTYTVEGNFNVFLIVTNTFGADTFTTISPIAVRFNNPPVAIACTPEPINASSFNISGIYNVNLHQINHSSGSAFDEGYENFSCLYQAFLHPDTSYPLSVRTNTIFEESVIAWIDWNNNAAFDNSERVLVSTGLEHLINVQAPSTAIRSVPLRMRVRVDQSGIIANACDAPFSGQIEDYAVWVIDPAQTRTSIFNSFKLYPNPAENQVNLQWQVGALASPDFEVVITDLLGKAIITEKVESGIGTKQLSIAGLQTGIYLVQVRANGLQHTFKLNKI
jgi:PKD repeat protein